MALDCSVSGVFSRDPRTNVYQCLIPTKDNGDWGINDLTALADRADLDHNGTIDPAEARYYFWKFRVDEQAKAGFLTAEGNKHFVAAVLHDAFTHVSGSAGDLKDKIDPLLEIYTAMANLKVEAKELATTFDKVLEIAGKKGDFFDRATLLTKAVVAGAKTGIEKSQLTKALEQVLATARSIANPRTVVLALINISRILLEAGLNEFALKVLNEAHDKAKRLDDNALGRESLIAIIAVEKLKAGAKPKDIQKIFKDEVLSQIEKANGTYCLGQAITLREIAAQMTESGLFEKARILSVYNQAMTNIIFNQDPDSIENDRENKWETNSAAVLCAQMADDGFYFEALAATRIVPEEFKSMTAINIFKIMAQKGEYQTALSLALKLYGQSKDLAAILLTIIREADIDKLQKDANKSVFFQDYLSAVKQLLNFRQSTEILETLEQTMQAARLSDPEISTIFNQAGLLRPPYGLD